MLPRAFVRGNNLRRLRLLLGSLFLALAVPTFALVWQAFDQLKWEAWFAHRGRAEVLTAAIDEQLAAGIAAADLRRFSDFAFFSATGGRFAERSALSALPIADEIPGAIGYFQVDPDGRFSTPLLPEEEGTPADFGLDREEWRLRATLARELHNILLDNRLVRLRAESGNVLQREELREADLEEALTAEQQAKSRFSASVVAPAESTPDRARQQAGKQVSDAEAYPQQRFDELNQQNVTNSAASAYDKRLPGNDTSAESVRAPSPRRLSDLALDDTLERKNEALNRGASAGADRDVNRETRVERESLPAAPVAEAFAEPAFATAAGPITAFESEVDPYEFSLLDSGHFVLFRKVWRDDKRYIQGTLVNAADFFRETVASSFEASGLSNMSDLIVSYHGNIIEFIPGTTRGEADSTGSFDGALLYQSRLSAPLQSLELVYSIRHLPPGPGAAVLGWTTLLISVVFLGGFATMYQLGKSQIRLAQQQQDFVSAVSHELKTPLTSIRMYSEMLREGWADEDRRQQYYEYIHDESERLSRLISNVLQLARITRNESKIELQALTVSQLIDQVRSKIASQVERAGFSLSIDTGDTAACTLNIDPDCFIQIVINLVDNAIKFSRDAERKEICVSAQQAENHQIVFAVRDFGPGIPRNRLREIFELFYRTESELTRETVGTGIGLAIVRQLSLAMNGSADVVNRSPGAEFQVRFPLAPA